MCKNNLDSTRQKEIYLIFTIYDHKKFYSLCSYLLLSSDDNQVFHNWMLKNKGNPWQALQAMERNNANPAAIEYGKDFIKDIHYKYFRVRALQAEGCFDEEKANQCIQQIQSQELNIDGIRILNHEIDSAHNLLRTVEATKNNLLKKNNGNLQNAKSEALVNQYNPKGTRESKTVFRIIFQQLNEEIKNQQSESK